MAVNINVELFKRYAPKKKLDLINGLSEYELLATTPETIKRIVKETGKNIGLSRDKLFHIDQERQKGNNWNSTVEAVEYIKGNLYLNIYFQMDSTDTNICEKYSMFFKSGDYTGKYYTTNRYGDSVPHYFTYNQKDKAEVIKSIFIEYVHSKYAGKL